MRPLFINRQSSVRPITSPKKGLSRWSRRRRTTLTDPNTIIGPGALILVASCEPVPTAMRQGIVVVAVVFPVAEPTRNAGRDPARVRISAAVSAESQLRRTPAREESRDATERSPAGSRSTGARRRSAQADGGRSEGARPSLRACAGLSRDSTRARRSSAARRVFVAVGRSNQPLIRRLPASARRQAGAGQSRPVAFLRASLTPVQTLPFWGKENSVPLKKNTGVFLSVRTAKSAIFPC